MKTDYQDSRIRYMGFWQETPEGMLASYKRVAMAAITFQGTELTLCGCAEGEAKWYLDEKPVQPEVVAEGYRFTVPEGKHTLKAVLVSPARLFLRGIQTDGAVLEPEHRPYIHFIGDSITHAYPGFASVAGESLGADYSVVAHCGMSLVDGWGWYPLVGGLQARVGMESNYFQLETPDVAAVFTPHRFAYGVKPDVIVVYLGVNDYLTQGPTFREENPEIFAQSYEAFVLRLHKQYPDTPFVLLQCHLPDRKIRIAAIEESYRRICRQVPEVTLLDTDLWNVAVCPDLVHPSGEGYGQMAVKVKESLETILRK